MLHRLMVRAAGVLAMAWVTACSATGTAELTDLERRWLDATAPVLRFARQLGLPLDIVVQPQPTPGETPLGMAHVGGRCKLVLSMRGNPEAQALLAPIPPALRSAVVEAIAAHEIGHCWRHVQQRWGHLPDGLHDVTDFKQLPAEQAAALREMWNTRREEGFADLVGLAWTLQHHAEHYEQIHAWHRRLRANPAIESGPHDTRVWVRLAADRARWSTGSSLFERAESLWVAGLLSGP